MDSNRPLNMNKFFGENYSSEINSDVSQLKLNTKAQTQTKSFIEDIETVLAPLKSEVKLLEDDNQSQNKIIQSISSSFDQLVSSANKLSISTEKVVTILSEDVMQREKNAKEEERIFSKETQRQRRKTKKLSAEELGREADQLNASLGIGAAGAAVAGLAAAASSMISGDNGEDNQPDVQTGNISGSTNQEKAFNYFVSLGASKEHAAGIVGNLMIESYTDIRPNADNGSHYGIAQWDKGDRWPRLVSWAQSKNKDPQKFETQLEYLTIENGYFKNFIKEPIKNAEGAAVRWEEIFERSGGQKNQERMRYAKSVLEKYGKLNRQSGTQPQASSRQSTNQPQASSSASSDTKVASASSGMDSEMNTKEVSMSDVGLKIENGIPESAISPSPRIQMPIMPTPQTPSLQMLPVPQLAQAGKVNPASVGSANNYSSPQLIRDPANIQSILSASARGVFLNA